MKMTINLLNLISNIVVILLLSGELTAHFLAGEWSGIAAIQYTTGNYIYENNTSTYYFYGGFRYKTQRWNISAILPIIGQNTNLVSHAGGMFLPNGESHGIVETSGGGHHRGMMADGLSIHHFDLTFGDLYLYGEIQLLPARAVLPSVHLNTQIKIPTASRAKNYGTGEFDYGAGLALRQGIANYALFFDAGYLVIGNPAGFTYQNPIILGFGVGRFFKGKDASVLVYFQNYSKILTEYQPARQIAAGILYKLNPRLLLSTSASAGMSEISPDFSISSGFELAL
jgi:hypothetical protein